MVKPATVGTVIPSIYVNGAANALPGGDVVRVVVDQHLHLPDMFEITLNDSRFDILTRSGLSIGTVVEVWAGARQDTRAARLVHGEVTSVEGMFLEGVARRAVVRGYTRDHRLQRARRTRTFLNVKDSDIARQLAEGAGLDIGDVRETRTTHDHVGQANQTDWDFLSWRARSVGFELGLADGRFYFREAANVTGRAGEPPVRLTYQDNLVMFRPRVTAGNLGTEAEVRGWDSVTATAVTAQSPPMAGQVKLDGTTVEAVVRPFSPPPAPPPPPAGRSPARDLGPAPSNSAHVVSLPMPTTPVADEALRGVAGEVGSTFAEAVGEANGDPRLCAGAVADIEAVTAQFSGAWVVTRAEHVFDPADHGYRTHFEVTGQQERSLLGLASRGAGRPGPPVVDGLVLGVVSNVLDDRRVGRVKVTLPWLSPRYETDWAPVVQAGGGSRGGTLFLPEVGDQVLVGFELGDPARPFVLGGVLTTESTYQGGLGGAVTLARNHAGDVVRRGIVSPSGNRLTFHDEFTPGEGGRATASEVVLGTEGGDLALTVDQQRGTVSLRCEPRGGGASTGRLTIACGAGGVVDIVTGAGGTVNIDGGARLNLTAQAAVTIESGGVLELKGKQIKLN